MAALCLKRKAAKEQKHLKDFTKRAISRAKGILAGLKSRQRKPHVVAPNAAAVPQNARRNKRADFC